MRLKTDVRPSQEAKRLCRDGLDRLGERPWRSLIALYSGYGGDLSLAAVYYFIKSAPIWAMPLGAANVIDVISNPQPNGMRALVINTLALTGMLALNVPFHCAYVRRVSLAARNVEAELRSSLIRKFQELSITYFKTTGTGALQSKVLRDVEAADQTARLIIDGGLNAAAAIIPAVIVTAIRAPQFLFVFAVAVPVFSILRITLTNQLQERNRDFRREVETMSSHVVGMIDMIPMTRAHGVEDTEIARAAGKLGEVKSAGLRLDAQNALFQSAAWTSFNLFTLGSLVAGAFLAYLKIVPLSAGEVVMLSSFFATISNSVLLIANLLPNITRGFESLRSIGEVLDSPDIERNVGKRKVREVRGAFRFENVTFVHRDARHSSIRDFSLQVAPGETVAIVGPSGAGKSTLLSLILGFHRPASGRILLDDEDMDGIDLRSLRKFVGVVAQETLLFNGSLRENLVYGSRKVSDVAIMGALNDANARDILETLPNGLETLVGERGERLSGGQRQRIAIARALIRDPRVLILDEATSALDIAAEKQVQSALQRLARGRTTFIVTHRLSMVHHADRIVVLEGGRIAEAGSPTELQECAGPYAAMRALY